MPKTVAFFSTLIFDVVMSLGSRSSALRLSRR